jgi:hypothetical protein
VSSISTGGPLPPRYTPPTQPGRDVELGMAEIVNKLDSIAVANQRIADSLAGAAAGVQSYQEDSKQIRNYAAGPRRRNQQQDEEQAAASEQELVRIRNETIQRDVILSRNEGRLRENHSAMSKLDPRERMQMLERYGQCCRVKARTSPQQAFLFQMFNKHSKPSAQEPLILVAQTFSTLLMQESCRVWRRQSHKKLRTRAERILDAVEESGIKQLRYGQLPLQDLLRSAGTLAGRYYQRTATRAVDANDRVQRARELNIEPDPRDLELAGRASRFLETGRPGALGAQGRTGGWRSAIHS